MKIFSRRRCDSCGTRVNRGSDVCTDCERTARHSELLELYESFDEREAAIRRADRMAAAIVRVAARTRDEGELGSALVAGLRTRLSATA